MPARNAIAIIALDPLSAALSEHFRERLVRPGETDTGRIQLLSLLAENECLKLAERIDHTARTRFDLATSRGADTRPPEDVRSAVAKLEVSINSLIRSGRGVWSLDKPDHGNGKAASQQLFYLVLCAGDAFAGGIVVELALLIRWLYSQRYPEDPYSLQAIILLPELFQNAGEHDYAATYGLLKLLDSSTENPVQVTPQLRFSPFDECWLIDSRNQNGVHLGTLNDNLDTYCDALIGFMTAEPEKSGALKGTRKIRGKSPTFSTFGYGELYLPSKIAVERLSAALARDITAAAFLPAETDLRPDRRKLLIASKQLMIRDELLRIINSLDRLEGKLIWTGFRPSARLRRGSEQEYIGELQSESKLAAQRGMLDAQDSLLRASDHVAVALQHHLEEEIDQRCDLGIAGLTDAIELLDVLVDTSIEIEIAVLGERPENLITKQRKLLGALDDRIGVKVDRRRTNSLLEKLEDLYQVQKGHLRLARLRELGSSNRGSSPEDTPQANFLQEPPEAPIRVEEVLAGERDAAGSPAASVGPAEKEQPGEEEPELSTQQPEKSEEQPEESSEEQLANLQRQIEKAIDEYRHAIAEEDERAIKTRIDGMRQARVSRNKQVESREQELVSIARDLSAAEQELEDASEQQQRFIKRFLGFYPLMFGSGVTGVLLLLALTDTGPSQALIGWLWARPGDVAFVVFVAAISYISWVLYKLVADFNPPVRKARRSIEELRGRLDATAARLCRAHDSLLGLEFEWQLHNERIKVITGAIETARELRRTIGKAIEWLEKTRKLYERRFEKAEPPISICRRPVLTPENIDAFYLKSIPNPALLAEEFCGKEVRRSRVRSISAAQFRNKLESFCRARFEYLSSLSIDDVLLREPELIPPNEAEKRLQDLSDAACPLLQLREFDTNRDGFAEYDVTLWASDRGNHRLLDHFRKLYQSASIVQGDDQQTLRALSRRLSFPAYFISQVYYYRDIYLRHHAANAMQLPDLIPEELDQSGEIREAYSRLMIGLALGLVRHESSKGYYLSGSQRRLGTNREEIARQLATEFTCQDVYIELSDAVEEGIEQAERPDMKLRALLDSLENLTGSERRLLKRLAESHHPLQ